MRDSSSSPGLLTAVTPTTCRPVAHSSRNPICANGRRCFGDNHSERSLSHRTKLSIDPLVPIGELHTVGLQCCGPDRWTTFSQGCGRLIRPRIGRLVMKSKSLRSAEFGGFKSCGPNLERCRPAAWMCDEPFLIRGQHFAIDKKVRRCVGPTRKILAARPSLQVASRHRFAYHRNEPLG
jgi:hypothetical protein